MPHVTRIPLSRSKVKGQLTGAWEYCGGLAYIVLNIHQLVNIHGVQSYWKQGALGAAVDMGVTPVLKIRLT